MLLFLDFDGVLHPRATKNPFVHIPRIQEVLRDFPTLRVVISSSWREGMPPAEIQKLFSEDLRDRIIGATPMVDFKYPPGPVGHREEEIRIFMAQIEYREEKWLALDDEAPFFTPGCPNLILCNSLTGLDDEVERRLRGRLLDEFSSAQSVTALKGLVRIPVAPVTIEAMNNAIISRGKKTNDH